MKKIVVITALLIAGFIALPTLHAEEGHEHEHKLVGGPKGGRLLDNTDPRAEFFVEKDRSVTITFYDDALKPVAAMEQTVTVIAEMEGVKTTVEFEKKDDMLISRGALPDGHALNLVVQFKQTVDAKPVNFRFVYEDHICGECKRAEYACICGH